MDTNNQKAPRDTEGNIGGFAFTYSAKEQSEIERIRKKYAPEPRTEESKMDKLRRLDRGVTRKATIIALTLGVIGVLILGSGMSMVMTPLPEYLGLSDTDGMIVGVILGLAGCIPTALAYPIHERVLRRERKRIAPEVIRLTDELLK